MTWPLRTVSDERASGAACTHAREGEQKRKRGEEKETRTHAAPYAQNHATPTTTARAPPRAVRGTPKFQAASWQQPRTHVRSAVPAIRTS